MNILFLVAGYGTRLQQDLLESNSHHNLLDLPKALLPLNSKPLLDYWMQIISESNLKHSNVYLITNDRYFNTFKTWATSFELPLENIINDHSVSNETRLGAVKDIHLANAHIENSLHGGGRGNPLDLLIVAGDTLFLEDFEFDKFIRLKEKLGGDACLITCNLVGDDQTYKSGIMELDEFDAVSLDDGGLKSFRVKKFVEKPGPNGTASRLACPCFYYIPAKSISFLDKFLEEMNGKELSEYDATGKFIGWLADKFPIYSCRISGRLDIGGLSSYISADKYMSRKD